MYGWFSESISWFICNTWLCVCKLLGNDHHMSADNSVHYHPATFPSKNLHLHEIVYIFRSRYSFYWKDVQKLKVATARGQFLLEIWVVKVKAAHNKRFLKHLILWSNKTVLSNFLILTFPWSAPSGSDQCKIGWQCLSRMTKKHDCSWRWCELRVPFEKSADQKNQLEQIELRDIQRRTWIRFETKRWPSVSASYRKRHPQL